MPLGETSAWAIRCRASNLLTGLPAYVRARRLRSGLVNHERGCGVSRCYAHETVSESRINVGTRDLVMDQHPSEKLNVSGFRLSADHSTRCVAGRLASALAGMAAHPLRGPAANRLHTFGEAVEKQHKIPSSMPSRILSVQNRSHAPLARMP